jgi:hypothetical protein
MPDVTGRVVEVMVSSDYGWTRIEQEDGSIPKLIIWSEVVEDYSPTQRILHGMWLALLRDALTNNLIVDAGAPQFGTMDSLTVRT